jgi:hypothetical protein
MKRSILILGSILVLTLSVLTFIYFSNDHKECSKYVENKVDTNGNNVVSKKHVCKEKYNF